MKRPRIAEVTARSLIQPRAPAVDASRDGHPTRDDVIGPERDDVIASPRESAPSAATAEIKPVKAGSPLPHASLYVHPRVLRALKLVALERGVRQQDLLREAVQRYLAEKGHPFQDLTAGT